MTHTELRDWRESQNMTRKQLGELLNTPPKSIKNWETRPELSGHRRIPGIVPAFIRERDSAAYYKLTAFNLNRKLMALSKRLDKMMEEKIDEDI